jgi:hypothetical protein
LRSTHTVLDLKMCPKIDHSVMQMISIPCEHTHSCRFYAKFMHTQTEVFADGVKIS